jgi:hypothetical protein
VRQRHVGLDAQDTGERFDRLGDAALFDLVDRLVAAGIDLRLDGHDLGQPSEQPGWS